MGVSITIREGESIEAALRRFRMLVRRFGPPGVVKRPKWHKNQLRYYLKPSERRRRRRIRDAWERYSGERSGRQVVVEKVRGKKLRRFHYRV